ncbi:MAG: hypothetical protein M1823_008560, partial [Watsoniomyces obsoletus]
AFVAYLDELEQYMDPYTERQRAFTLLDGLRPDIGRKIRERADMPEKRSEMASLAINIEEAQKSASTRSMREPRAGPSQGPRGLPYRAKKASTGDRPRDQGDAHEDAPRTIPRGDFRPRGNFGGKAVSGQRGGGCWQCRDPGHIKRDCRKGGGKGPGDRPKDRAQ